MSATQPVVSLDGEVIPVKSVSLKDLFPSSQIGAAHARFPHQTVYELLGASKLSRRVGDAIVQIFSQTPRRHRRLAIEDDEFFHADKVQRIEHARKSFRTGTRMNHPIPERKKPMSTLLKPMTLSTDKKYIFTEAKDGQNTFVPTSAPLGFSFPGSVPVSLMEADIPKLYDGAYFFVWAPKTNGLRFFMVGCTFGHERMLLLVNRSQQFFLLPGVVAPDLIFDGTILDGELVPTRNGGYAYIAYECAISCGVPCSEYNYLVRLQIAGLLTESWNKMTANAPAAPAGEVRVEIDWRAKRVYSPDKVYEMVVLDLPTLDHDTDGFISTAVEPPIQIGETNTIFKVKRATDHTIDFMAIVKASSGALGAADSKLTFDLVALHNKGVNHSESGVLWDTVTLSGANLQATAQRLGYTQGTHAQQFGAWLNERIVECRYHRERKSWDIDCVRADKQTPNKLSTALKTWTNIKENLSLGQIFPEGSMPSATRKQLLAWEEAHPLWKTTASDPPPTVVPTFMAPAPLKKLATYN